MSVGEPYLFIMLVDDVYIVWRYDPDSRSQRQSPRDRPCSTQEVRRRRRPGSCKSTHSTLNICILFNVH